MIMNILSLNKSEKKHGSKNPGKFGLLFALHFIFSVSLLTFLFPTAVLAKENINLDNSSYSIIFYDSNNGLPTSEANAIAQTKDGFIWIGSYSGLIRYSGNEFIRYDSQVGIASVMCLYVDSKDRLWIGTNDSGAALYEDGEFYFYNRDNGLNSLSIRSITEDKNGNIILATTKGIAYIDETGELNILSDDLINNEYISMVKSDEYGLIYGVTTNGALFSIDDLKIKYFNAGISDGTGFSCVYPVPGKKNEVYLGTWNSKILRGSISDDLKSAREYNVSPQSNINMIFSSGDNVLICADNGIGYIGKDNKYRSVENSPLNNHVDYVMEDYEGNLWFASSRQGVMEITTSLFTDISRLAGLDAMVVNSTCKFDDDLYIGSDTGLVILDKNFKSKQNNLTELLEGIRVRCIKRSEDGNLWICTYGDNGLVKYDGNNYEIFNEVSGLASNWVRTMCELSDGTIAVSASGGLTLIKDGKIYRTYTSDDGIDNTEILTICDGGDGTIYLGSDGDGIYIIDGDDIKHIGMDEGLQSEIILRIKKDPEKNLFWVITSNSISYIENGEVKTVSNFPYSNNFDMYFSKDGEIWILSSNGIYAVKKDLLFTDEKLEYNFYNFQCGLPCVATANSRSYLDDDGTLYISGTSGVSSISLDKHGQEISEIKLAIPYVEIDDEIISTNNKSQIVIPSDCRRITIHGYALTYKLHNPHLSYMLEGFDDEKVMTTVHDMEPTTYTNLRGGKYVFHLKLVDSFTGEESIEKTLTIYKKKAFYEYYRFWIAIGVIAIFVIVAAALIYSKYKTAAYVKKQEETKTYINQMISAFAKSIDLKDKYTNGHSFRVAIYSKMLAEKWGYPKDKVDEIYHIALLHDIGKITIPDEILNKPGKLSDEEYEIIKRHASNGYDILKEIEISPELALGAGFHHERIDGMGYPTGKKGDEIPMIAQIIAVADMFDAMNSTRPYRKKVRMEDIEKELRRVAGTQLNEDIVNILLKLIHDGAFDNIESN